MLRVNLHKLRIHLVITLNKDRLLLILLWLLIVYLFWVAMLKERNGLRNMFNNVTVSHFTADVVEVHFRELSKYHDKCRNRKVLYFFRGRSSSLQARKAFF